MSIFSSDNKTLFGSVFKLINISFAFCSSFLSSICSFQSKCIQTYRMFSIKFIIHWIFKSFNYFAHYYFFIYSFWSNNRILFNNSFGLKLNSPLINALTFSLKIFSSLFFILSLGSLRFLSSSFSLFLGCIGAFCFVAFFNLSLGCTETFFMNSTSSCCSFVALLNLSLGCTGICFKNATLSSAAPNFLSLSLG